MLVSGNQNSIRDLRRSGVIGHFDAHRWASEDGQNGGRQYGPPTGPVTHN